MKLIISIDLNPFLQGDENWDVNEELVAFVKHLRPSAQDQME